MVQIFTLKQSSWEFLNTEIKSNYVLNTKWIWTHVILLEYICSFSETKVSSQTAKVLKSE